jgi:hypothetical protein
VCVCVCVCGPLTARRCTLASSPNTLITQTTLITHLITLITLMTLITLIKVHARLLPFFQSAPGPLNTRLWAFQQQFKAAFASAGEESTGAMLQGSSANSTDPTVSPGLDVTPIATNGINGTISQPNPMTTAPNALNATDCTSARYPTLLAAQRAASACRCDPAQAHDMGGGNFSVTS